MELCEWIRGNGTKFFRHGSFTGGEKLCLDVARAVDGPLVARVRLVHVHEHDAEARSAVSQALGAQTGRPLPAPLLNAAWPHLDFTADALRSTVETAAQRAHALGMFPSQDLTGLFDEARCARAIAVAGGSA